MWSRLTLLASGWEWLTCNRFPPLPRRSELLPTTPSPLKVKLLGCTLPWTPLDHTASAGWPQCNLLAGEIGISLLPGAAGLSVQAGAVCRGVVRDGRMFLRAGGSLALCPMLPSACLAWLSKGVTLHSTCFFNFFFFNFSTGHTNLITPLRDHLPLKLN